MVSATELRRRGRSVLAAGDTLPPRAAPDAAAGAADGAGDVAREPARDPPSRETPRENHLLSAGGGGGGAGTAAAACTCCRGSACLRAVGAETSTGALTTECADALASPAPRPPPPSGKYRCCQPPAETAPVPSASLSTSESSPANDPVVSSLKKADAGTTPAGAGTCRLARDVCPMPDVPTPLPAGPPPR